MKIINKNELTILVIALMLVTAGYLDYIGRNKSQEVSAEVVENQDISQTDDEIAKLGDAKLVSDNQMDEEVKDVFNENNESKESTADTDEYFVSTKLERTNMYSQTIENYQAIIENPNVSEEQKAVATQEISRISQIQNAIMISENLLLAKGFDKSIIFVNDTSISVIIGKDNLSSEEIAQIQNIVSRELGASLDNIHISVK